MNKRGKRSNYLDEIINEYIQGASKFYPGLRFGQRYSMFSGDEPESCDFEFSFRAQNLRRTPYIPKEESVIHYTSSLQSLFEILNSGYLRLSNLNALNDPQELSFIKNVMGIELTEDQVKEYKNHYFSGSFCKVIENEPVSFPMWRLYGGDGKGAAIVFDLINSRSDWHKYLFAKVQYGQNAALNRFKKFISFHNEFQLQHKRPIHNWPKALIALMALHKNSIWSHENEIRLLTHYPFDKYTYNEDSWDSQICNLKHSITATGKPFAFVELPLFEGKEYRRLGSRMKERGYEGELENSIPILKIKKIILGYRLESKLFAQAQEMIQYISKKEYQYNFYAADSHLRKYMG
jgi:hypothetical protein